MTKITKTGLSALVLLGTVLSDNASAQTASEAEIANDNGKKHFKGHRYLDAYREFKKAAALAPQGRYFFNVCYSLDYLERYQEAIEACEKVLESSNDENLRNKTNLVLKSLREKSSLPPTDSAVAPVLTEPASSQDQPVAPPQDQSPPQQVVQPSPSYEWSLGLNFGPFVNTFGSKKFYDSTALRINVFANFNLFKSWGIGAQSILSFTDIAVSGAEGASSSLTLIDFGGLLYKDISAGPIVVTPGAGLLINYRQPNFLDNVSYVSAGLRAFTTIGYPIDKDGHHVISVSSAFNYYSAGTLSSNADNSALDPKLASESSYGADLEATTLEFMLGYEFRFTTPFNNSQPLFTLE